MKGTRSLKKAEIIDLIESRIGELNNRLGDLKKHLKGSPNIIMKVEEKIDELDSLLGGRSLNQLKRKELQTYYRTLENLIQNRLINAEFLSKYGRAIESNLSIRNTIGNNKDAKEILNRITNKVLELNAGLIEYKYEVEYAVNEYLKKGTFLDEDEVVFNVNKIVSKYTRTDKYGNEYFDKEIRYVRIRNSVGRNKVQYL